MLKHEDNPSNSSQPAAQVRVTPEELAAAITRLEVRKEVGQRDLEGTVAIGEVVQQLGLDATPEELLAEVQAGRQQSEPQKRRPLLWDRLVLAAGLSGAAFALWLCIELFAVASSAINPQPSPPSALAAAPSILVQDRSGNTQILRTLGEVPDNRPVYCMFNFYSKDGFTSYSMPDSSWTLVKHGGKTYVRGWTMQMSDQAIQVAGKIRVYDKSPGGDAIYVPVTLALDSFKCVESQSDMNSFVAADVHLDSHAYEKW